ncbi:roadblock/LC7 domain-containing protein [Actimicrobium antarcticum]|uniref:Roadblock/LAMTOR2 domain-containing protein n=1 Tax=Actimicrobium antarcticum TaxID=1051899 RepID=A0ABP7SL82_9BURK
MTIDPHIKTAADLTIATLMSQVKGIRAVVISTEDGFEVAARVENTAQVTRLAAIASSLTALGAVAGEESQLGACENVIIGAKNGCLIMLQARTPHIDLILSVITNNDVIVGQALYFSKQAVQALRDL